MGVMRASVVALALGTYSRDHERWGVNAVADFVRVRLSKWASIEVEPFCAASGAAATRWAAKLRRGTPTHACVPS